MNGLKTIGTWIPLIHQLKLLDPHKNFHVGEELTKKKFVWMQDNVIYVNPFLKTLVGSKTNSSNDNPWKWWMVFVPTSWIENWIIVVIND